ncbi:MAG: VWA domain-containing protein [Isosphaeraceae bacterium]
MFDRLTQVLVERLGVAPAGPGERVVPRLRFDQPWSQSITAAVLLIGLGLIISLYRRERGVPSWGRWTLAALRCLLFLVALVAVNELVLAIDRTGLPHLAIMVDDSASQAMPDQYSDPEVAAAVERLTGASGSSLKDLPRIEIAKRWIARDSGEVLTRLQKNHRLKVYGVGSTTRMVAEVDKPEQVTAALEAVSKLEASGTESRLGEGVKQVLSELRGIPPTALVFLTDGQTTDGETIAKAAESAKRADVPLYLVGLGDPQPPRNVELADMEVDDVAFVDDVIPFAARLTSQGFAGEELTLRLYEQASPGSQPKLLTTKNVKAPPDGRTIRIPELDHRPRETGEITYIIESVPKDREQSVADNRVQRKVTVKKEKLKVLLVDGQPRYQYRYLKNFLERDETIELSALLLSSDPEYADQDNAAIPVFPTSKDDLLSYDVIVLGDIPAGFLTTTQIKNLVEFVTVKGGGLVMISGELANPLTFKGTPLADLLPIELADARNPTRGATANDLSAYRPRLTLEGRSSPIFRFGSDESSSLSIWENLPELYWYMEAPRLKPAAVALAEHPIATGSDGPLPLLAYQFAGSGKVFFQAFDDTWRWRFRAGDKYFGRYWIQLMRFMARNKLVGNRQAELQADRARYQRGDMVQIRVKFVNQSLVPAAGPVKVELARQGMAPKILDLPRVTGSKNLFQTSINTLSEGSYTARLLPPPVIDPPVMPSAFVIEPPASERARPSMNRDELMQAARISGGKFFTADGLDTLIANLPPPAKVPLDTDPPIPLWNSWPILVLFLIILLAEWLLRRKLEMV